MPTKCVKALLRHSFQPGPVIVEAPPERFAGFLVAYDYACDNCGKKTRVSCHNDLTLTARNWVILTITTGKKPGSGHWCYCPACWPVIEDRLHGADNQ